MDRQRINRLSLSLFPEGESFGQFVEVRRLLQQDGDLGIDLSSSLSFHVLLSDGLDGRKSVLREDLCELKSEGNALSHALDLHTRMLLQHQLRKEKSLV